MALLARFPCRRLCRLLLSLGAGIGTSLALAGCGTPWQLPTVLYVTVGTNADQTIDGDLLNYFNTQLGELVAGFQRLSPNTTFQLSLYPEDRIVEELRLRNRAGLGPDLVLVRGEVAAQLLQAGLTDPFPAGAAQLNVFDPQELQRLRNGNGELAGLPLLVQTQLACFNRSKLPMPPATVQELLQTSANGVPIGLPADLVNLFWTAGSQGAIPGLKQAALNQPLTSAEQEGVERWMGWLQNASNQQRVVFYATQKNAETRLSTGDLAWIPCRSSLLPQLRRSLGPRLGVAPLPDGDAGQASPINRLRVIALGSNSSRLGRQRALSFARFSINPLTQRSLTLGSLTALPANRFVRVPVHSSSVLAAMVISSQQGRQSNQLVALLPYNEAQRSQLQSITNELVFGEVSPQDATRQLIRALNKAP
ncbi:MAG: ABC transporter substrate-binding protein [Cyanobacteriota bacterium]|nr:ABC transporter substrate-binding protein [Cyanobacteriota bacterium]